MVAMHIILYQQLYLVDYVSHVVTIIFGHHRINDGSKLSLRRR
jgi:hypothetical protein